MRRRERERCGNRVLLGFSENSPSHRRTNAVTPPMSNHHAITALSPEPLSASGRSSEKLSLPLLQSKMKCDPDGYEAELTLVYKQFNAALDLFQQQAALNFSSISGIGSDPNVAKDLGDRAMFLAHVMPFYRKQLAEFPSQLAEFLKSSAPTLPSGLRCHVTQALILLVNRQVYGDDSLKYYGTLKLIVSSLFSLFW